MSRRGRGEGSIYQRQDGRWVAALTIGETETGSQRRRTVYGATRKDVAARLAELQSLAAAGGLVEPSHLTLRDLAARWLESKARTVRASTLADYRYTWERYILPRLGDVRVQKLGPLRLEAHLDELGARYSARMVRQVRVLLHGALGQAVRWGILATNPVEAIDAPATRRQPPRVWTPDQVGAFLEASRRSRYHAAFYLALTAGLRRGEALGLRVSDVDHLAGLIRIRRTVQAVRGRVAIGEPKTAAGVRTVHLAEDALQVLAARLEALAGEVARARHVGRWAGPEDPWVFGTHMGRPTNPSELLRAFARIVDQAGVPRIRFHDLRHTYASLALRSGVSLPAVSLRLGHSSPTITSEIYAHVVPGDERSSALSLAELGAPRETTPNAGSCTGAVNRPSDSDPAVN